MTELWFGYAKSILSFQNNGQISIGHRGLKMSILVFLPQSQSRPICCHNSFNYDQKSHYPSTLHHTSHHVARGRSRNRFRRGGVDRLDIELRLRSDSWVITGSIFLTAQATLLIVISNWPNMARSPILPYPIHQLTSNRL